MLIGAVVRCIRGRVIILWQSNIYALTNHRETNKLFGHESARVFSISILNTMSIQERGHETQASMVGSCRPWPALPLGRKTVERLTPRGLTDSRTLGDAPPGADSIARTAQALIFGRESNCLFCNKVGKSGPPTCGRHLHPALPQQASKRWRRARRPNEVTVLPELSQAPLCIDNGLTSGTISGVLGNFPIQNKILGSDP